MSAGLFYFVNALTPLFFQNCQNSYLSYPTFPKGKGKSYDIYINLHLILIITPDMYLEEGRWRKCFLKE